MKNENSSTSSVSAKKENPSAVAGLSVTKRGFRYRFWVLSAVLVLAFWSMFTGSVSIKWSSSSDITHLYDDVDFPIHDGLLDILEVEEREKVVRRMWDVYSHSSGRVGLPRFWQEAFEAAYEHLISDVPGVRDVAVSEIAKMSMRFLNIDSAPRRKPERNYSKLKLAGTSIKEDD